jgi:hypothetical protein
MPDATAITVANKIVNFLLTYGISDQIHTDQGTNFQSDLLQHIYVYLMNTKQEQLLIIQKQMVTLNP